jgi:predicted nuclease of predicted toxin-antitoxin system
MAVEVASGLVAAGHDAVHTSTYGLSRAGDVDVLARAAEEHRVLISADTDFGGLLASQQAAVPSVLLYRRRTRRRPHELVMILLANLAAIQEDLERGAIVVIEDHGMRVRRLPIG